MLIIVACSCGERFDLPESMAGKQTPCPHCGQKLDIPSQPPYSFVSQALLGPGTGWNPDKGVPTGDAFEQLSLCPNCAGSGKCPTCRGKGANYHAAWFWECFRNLLKGEALLYEVKNRIATARCCSCNDNGKCRACYGYGRLLMRFLKEEDGDASPDHTLLQGLFLVAILTAASYFLQNWWYFLFGDGSIHLP